MNSSCFSNFNTWYDKSGFEKQKTSIIFNRKYRNLSYYTVVNVLLDRSSKAIITVNETGNSITAFAYTEKPELTDNNLITEEYSIGELTSLLSSNKVTTFVKINPHSYNADTINTCEDVIYCPLLDKTSKQLTITSLNQTLPLIAINHSKVKLMNFEAVYGFFRESDLPNDREGRTECILKMINFIKLAAKKTPIKFGSSSVICVFLDFEDPIEENQFIQNYDLMDSYTNIIFVNSQLEIINTYRQKIKYDGDKIETILLPIIEWQKNNNPARQELL
mgnify:CR=1 FL=1